MPMVGHRVLVHCVLSALPTFTITVLREPKKFFQDIDKSRLRFLWAQDEEISRGKCKVRWKAVTSPEAYGDLGIYELPKFTRATAAVALAQLIAAA
ncbi:putative reverse transcriptase [Hordeum vulgare]|nr:putative reverse transcriptase [Hordeum vulgare]